MIEYMGLQPVLDATNNGKSKHYEAIRSGLMVPPIPLGPRKKGYVRHEVEAVNAARLRGATDDEIRQLVRQLIEERKAAHEVQAINAARVADEIRALVAKLEADRMVAA